MWRQVGGCGPLCLRFCIRTAEQIVAAQKLSQSWFANLCWCEVWPLSHWLQREWQQGTLWDMLHFHGIRFNAIKFERLDFDVEDSDSYVLTPFDYVHIKTSRMREACALHVSAIILSTCSQSSVWPSSSKVMNQDIGCSLQLVQPANSSEKQLDC